MKSVLENQSWSRVFTSGFIGGIGWALGVTLGFSVIALVISQVLAALGGLPLIGTWLASVIQFTQDALNSRY